MYGEDFDIDAFNDFIASAGLSPGFQARNSVNADWSTRWDLGIAQELPLGVDDLKGVLFLNIYNLGNLLNDDWGKMTDAQFFPQRVVTAEITDEGQYEYLSVSSPHVNDLQEFNSLWQIKMGIKVQFR